MITDADFSRLRVFRDLVFGKTGRMGMLTGGGRISFLTKRGMWRLFNEANGAVRILTEAATLTEEDNGKTILLHATTGFTTTLPPIAAGMKLRFVVSVQPTSGNNVILSQTADVITGPIADLAGTGDAANAADQINLVASQAAVGDWVDVECLDGIRWFVRGAAAVAAGITATG